MEKLSKYKKQIFTFITIFLLLEFGVYPCLTAADTFSNIIGAIALLVLILWGALELYSYATSSKEEPTKVEEAVIEKPKAKRKHKTKK